MPRFDQETREWLYQRSLRKPRTSKGTPYPCSQDDLERCLSLQAPNLNPYVEPMEATYQLVRFNRLTKPLSIKEDNALNRLEGMLTHVSNPGDWEPSIAIKAFKDLDTLFFMSRLRGNCKVRWMDAEHRLARDGCFGSTDYLAHGQAQIHLNAKRILLDCPEPFIEMWRTLLHEMCHAYEVVMSGWNKDMPHDKRIGNSPGHGIHFCTVIQAVHRRAKKLLGLSAIDSLREPYNLDKFDKHHFEGFLAMKAREQQRQQAWEIYSDNGNGQNHQRGHGRGPR